ncbi:transferrin [Condylostylus longicornis]|uniref:transferrin n=1 Tax=Condylostylus longicornis TaxID=2530218 RepID=UPI00244DD3D5|nr:transferrin [Condylostylus longicornis]
MKYYKLLFIFILIILIKFEYNFAIKNSITKNDNEKIRVCIVEGRGSYKKGSKFCPILENSNSNMECVIGVDRLDCVRRIHKGTAHFGVFSSEDLIAARYNSIEILVTNEMRFHDTPFEYEIVAIVDNESGINSAHDLRGSRFCHPGHGLENHMTEILGKYFESVLVPKKCDENLSLTESRIRDTANFFGPSCKAGPWVPDPVQDRILKTRYPSLCEICYDSYRCGIGDKHWGRRGSLYCLTSGIGEVAWARLDDIQSHFGFSGLPPEANPNEYSFVCPDGHLQPLNTTHPCVWVAKPWPAVAAQRQIAAKIQDIVSRLSYNNEEEWRRALLSLIEPYRSKIQTLDNTITIDDYLDQAIGFQSAYSFPECNPPRSIVYCTTSIIQHVKCSWLQEISQVYGIQPNIQCIRTLSIDECLEDVKDRVADVVLVDQDTRIKAQRDYNLIPLLYEFSKEMHERYVTIAVVKKKSKFKNFESLRDYQACFPSYEGAAYISVLEAIANITHQEYESIPSYFTRKSCIWKPNGHTCPEAYKGDAGALKCLADGYGDVAFISSDIYKNFTDGLILDKSVDRNEYEILCPYGHSKKSPYELCYLHWTPRGHIMVHNTTLTRQHEIYNSLKDMDRLFGKHYKEHTKPFTMYGPFDKRSNIMFRDNTDGLKGYIEMKKDSAERLLEDIYKKYSERIISNSSNKNYLSVLLIGILIVIISFY